MKGYYDQAHFIKDFKGTGLSPKSFFRKSNWQRFCNSRLAVAFLQFGGC
jgi:hypothetical protein